MIRRVKEQPNGDGTWTVREIRTGKRATIPGTSQLVPERQTQRDAHDLAVEINWAR